MSCGKCCHLLIEVDLTDADREPKIKQVGSPISDTTGEEHVGYLLNVKENDCACAFLDRQ